MAYGDPGEVAGTQITVNSAGRPMLAVLATTWALFFAMALVMLGNGLQGSLLGLRATIEGFPTAVTGIVMSGYFAGFATGSYLTPKLVARVGHIRVFAALASLASIVALLHVILVTPATWTTMRLATGFCYAGIYVVAESWLNDRVTNDLRGQLLSVYLIVGLAGMATGPLLLNLADPGSFELFLLVSVLVSLALIPILLTANPAPAFETATAISVRQLYRLSPLGVTGATVTGLSNGTVVGMGAVYAERLGLSLAEISFFMSALMVGGVALQWPIGRLSDRFDRRIILTAVTLLAALVALAATAVAGHSFWVLLLLIGLFGGLSFPLYSLSLAHTNDRLEPSQMVGASSGLVLLTGAGATLGPVSAAAAMTAIGNAGFFWFLAAVHAALGVFALFRMTRRGAGSLEHRAPYVTLASASPVATAMAQESALEGMAEEPCRPELP